MKTTIAAILAVFSLATQLQARTTITTIKPSDGYEHVVNTVNGVTPVANIEVDNTDDNGTLLGNINIEYDGEYPSFDNKEMDLCLLEGGRIVWQAPAQFKKSEYEIGYEGPDGEVYTETVTTFSDYYNVPVFTGKGQKKTYALGIIRRGYVSWNQYADIKLRLYLYGNKRDYAKGSTSWIVFDWNDSVGLGVQPVDSLKDEQVKNGKHILGGFKMSTYSNNWSEYEEEFVLTDPTFRVFTSGGKITDILGLELRDETGRLLLKGATLTDMKVNGGSGEYALMQFKGQIALPRGEVSVFVHGRVGATFKGGASITLGCVAKDQGLMESTESGVFSINSDYVERSRELTFGVAPKPVTKPSPVPVPVGNPKG